MFPFHCNQCFRRSKTESLDLSMSRCGHILCSDCMQPNCCICGRPYERVPINKDMPQSMAEYFSDPIKQYQHYRKVVKFQHEQERRLVQHLCQTTEEGIKKAREEQQAYAKIQEALKRDMEREREKIRKLKEYIKYHESRFIQTGYMAPPIIDQPRPRYPPRSHSMDNIATTSESRNRYIGPIMQHISRPLPPHVSSPSLTSSHSTNSSSLKLPEPPKPIAKKQRNPPPLLPCSQHKLFKQQFSFSSMD